MADRFSGFDANLSAVLQRLEEVERRVRELESQLAAGLEPVRPTVRPSPFAAPRQRFNGLTTASLAGRTSLVLGGGYLLRALTSSGVLPLPIGVALGLAYAVLWIVMADRAGAGRRVGSASAHAIAAAAVAGPLLVEAMVMFRFLDAWSVALNLTVIVALGLAVGWYRWLQPVVWIFTVASIATALVLLRLTDQPAPVALHLVALATLTYWCGYDRPWWRAAWLSALVADGTVVWMTWTAATPGHGGAVVAIVAALALAAATLGSAAVRLLVFERDVVPFEMVQSAVALVAGYGGAAYLARVIGLSGTPFAAAALAVGALAYGVAFAGRVTRRNLQYFATVAIALVVAGGILLYRPPGATALWIALALAGTWLGKRLAATTWSGHGAAYLIAAAVASGLAIETLRALLGGSVPVPGDVSPAALAVLAAAAVCSAVSPLQVRTFGATNVMATIVGRRPSAGIPRAVALGVLTLGLSAVVVVWIVRAVWTPGAIDLGVVATIRTIVLALAVVLLALLARGGRVREAGWLVYPWLIATGLKMLAEDFRRSGAGPLFVALMVYGAVLIVAPRLAGERARRDGVEPMTSAS